MNEVSDTFTSVAIVGAGDLGGALAYKLATRHRVNEIRLIDPNGDIAAGKALDISEAGPLERSGTRVTGTPDLWAAAGSSVIVLADAAGAPSSEWKGETGVSMLKRLIQIERRACFVCAGAEQRSLVSAGVKDLDVGRARLVGSAPGALAGAVRALVALEARGGASEVAVTLVGVPPRHVVVVWSTATVRGAPVETVLSATALNRIAARLPYVWPPGPYALASAAARVCEAIVANTARRVFSCFVALDHERAGRGQAAALPVTLGIGGVNRVLEPVLSRYEQVQLENALTHA